MSAEFGQRLMERRKACGYDSAEELAQAMGTDEENVSQWERGSAEPPGQLLAALAALLGVSAQWLATGEGPVREKPAAAQSAACGRSSGGSVASDASTADQIAALRSRLDSFTGEVRAVLLAIGELQYRVGRLERAADSPAERRVTTDTDTPTIELRKARPRQRITTANDFEERSDTVLDARTPEAAPDDETTDGGEER